MNVVMDGEKGKEKIGVFGVCVCVCVVLKLELKIYGYVTATLYPTILDP